MRGAGREVLETTWATDRADRQGCHDVGYFPVSPAGPDWADGCITLATAAPERPKGTARHSYLLVWDKTVMYEMDLFVLC